ncbi:hypothetical protein GCM10007269_05780 [Microbacterium murale]|uniref:Uncharacterized protein n=1 Tax=Microbacterium murale TaxID=1081040 RepID=A0ABQ1RBY9_9MICO|nr:hypothetical protein GCM10007269_05780 [Microbacterium murale]
MTEAARADESGLAAVRVVKAKRSGIRHPSVLSIVHDEQLCRGREGVRDGVIVRDRDGRRLTQPCIEESLEPGMRLVVELEHRAELVQEGCGARSCGDHGHRPDRRVITRERQSREATEAVSDHRVETAVAARQFGAHVEPVGDVSASTV